MTLARYFLHLQAQSGLSLRKIASRTKPKLDPATVWKVVHGRPVRADTLGAILRALGYTERDQQYLDAFALWSTEQSGTLPLSAVQGSIARVQKKQAREIDRVIAQITAALKAMPEEDWPYIVEAAQHPQALKLWLLSRK